MLAITIIPFVAFVAAVALLWNTAVGWTDLGLLVVLYVFCGFGITIGFHRMLTHSAFEAVKPLKAGLLIFGSMAVQGSAITWAVDHRTHHAHSDKEGDPHSPHHGFGGGLGGQLRGLLHAHMGWMFSHPAGQERERMARDLSQDRLVRFIDRTFLLWAVLGFVVPFALGYRPHRHLAGRAHRPSVGRPGAAVPEPPRDLERQLDLPLLRAQAVPRLRPVHEQLGAGAARRWASRGITTTTCSRPRPSTVWARCSSTRPAS